MHADARMHCACGEQATHGVQDIILRKLQALLSLASPTWQKEQLQILKSIKTDFS